MKNRKEKSRLLSLGLVFSFMLGIISNLWGTTNGLLVNAEQDIELTQNTEENFGEFYLTEETEIPKQQVTAEKVVKERKTNHRETEEVRVFVVMEGEAVLDNGYSTEEIGYNTKAMNFSSEIEVRQEQILKSIKTHLKQDNLEVRYHFTLLANAISATVAYGDIEKIKEIDGVKEVYLVPTHKLQNTASPNTASAGEMVDSYQVWESGYTGAGERIAIIDTGIDSDHPSFDESAYQYGLDLTAQNTGKQLSDYQLLNTEEIDTKIGKLNASKMQPELRAEDFFRSDKIAYGFNYVDRNLDITHENDLQGDHGTHVAGIAAANQYLPNTNDSYKKQEDGVVGIAKDAQLLIMKVFGANGGAYTDDYMAAIEDALLLGADVINLSLGNLNAGETSESSETEQYVNEIFDKLINTDTIVSISAGNGGGWSDNSTYRANRTSDINMDTIGSPGSYTNAFTVASAQNAGITGHCIEVGEATIFYKEPIASKTVLPFANLDANGEGTEYEYVFFDSFGEAEMYQGQDVSGKIVLVRRGFISFTEKHQNAAAAGATGILIYNDESGVINMNLTDSKVNIPCAMISQEDAEHISKQGIVGSMKIFSKTHTFSSPDGYAISDFSSWGVPGDLTLKPEITAPGGNIYSTLDGGQYGNMSGTSMASPSIAGISALVTEYIKENKLSEKTGLSIRALTQSLLMSTAMPLTNENGNAYSPRKQGSGLANVKAATTSPVYILVGESSGNDGKVKIELGDDPSRNGIYAFDFSLYNFSEQKQYYTLSSSFLTEQVIDKKWFNGSPYPLQPEVLFTSANQEYIYDLNGDNQVNDKDALELLRHLNQSITLDKVTYYDNKFDFNLDGIVNTTDIYTFLKELEKETPDIDFSEKCVKVEKRTDISVQVSLSKADREYLDTYFEHGMYIDGFVYLSGPVALSIPMLAFYGNWTEASMFEPFDYLTYVNGGKETTPISYSGIDEINYLTYYFHRDNTEYCYASNMYCEQGDEEYIPERNAFSTESGDYFGTVTYSLIRNAASVKTSIINDETGEVYYENMQEGAFASYYSELDDQWNNIENDSILDWAGTDAKGNPLPEGTKVNITVTALPAYYKDNEEGASSGVHFTVPITIDNTAPKVINMEELEAGKIKITVSDNRYVAAINIYDRDKETQIGSYAVNQKEEGTPQEVIFAYPKHVFYIKVIDYAGNEKTYRVNKSDTEDTEFTTGVTLNQTLLYLAKGKEEKLIATVEPESILNSEVSWSSADETVATVNEEGVINAVGVGSTTITVTTNAKNAEGEKETAECKVMVEDITVSFNGIMWEENNIVQWCNFTSDNLDELLIISEEQEHPYMSATVIGDKLLAATYSTDGEQKSEIYLVNPAEEYSAQLMGTTYWCNDMAYSPNTSLVFAVYGTNVHWFHSTDAKNQGVSDFAKVTNGENLVGITYAGYSESNQYGSIEWFYAISQSGELYQLGYAIEYGQFLYMDVGASGIKTGKQWYFNSLYYDEISGHLFWAMYDGGNDVSLYVLKQAQEETSTDTTIHTYKIGQFVEGIVPIVGLHRFSEVDGKTYPAKEQVIENAQKAQLLPVSVQER